jgi:hypothetical protein
MANRLIQLKEQLNKMDLMKKMGVYLNEDQRPDIEAEIKLLEQEQEQHTLTNTPKEVLKLKMSSLTIKEPQLHTNTLLDEAHTNSLLNKNKKLKKNNKELIIEPDDETEKIELSKKLIDISTSDIQDNTIKQLSEKGLKENNISNISQDNMATLDYTQMTANDLQVGDTINFDYESTCKGVGVMKQYKGKVEKVSTKVITIDTHQYKKEKMNNIIKIELANVDEPDTEITPEIQTTYPENDMLSENNEMIEESEEEEDEEEFEKYDENKQYICCDCKRDFTDECDERSEFEKRRGDRMIICGDCFEKEEEQEEQEEEEEDEEQDEEEQHQEQLEAHGYATCERCEKDLPKGQIGNNGYCLACDGEESEEQEEQEEQEDEEQEEESEEDKEKREIAELERKLAEKKAKIQQKEITKSNEEREKEFLSYSRDMKTINRIREQYAEKIRKYAEKIGCPEWVINLGVNEEIGGEYFHEIQEDGQEYETWDSNELNDEDIEDFRQKHLEQMRKEFFKGVGEPKGEKKTDTKRKAPTKLCRESNRLFRDGELIRHIATKKGDKNILNTLFCYYNKNADKFILCDNNKKPMNFEGVGEIKNLNQFIIVNNKKYVPEKVQKETAWAGSVTIYRENKWISVGKIEPIA